VNKIPNLSLQTLRHQQSTTYTSEKPYLGAIKTASISQWR